MKRTLFSHLMLVAFVGSLVFAGCKKDETIAPAGNGSLRLTAEKLSGEGKTYVDQLTVGWVSDDEVRINGTVLTVGENGTITGTPEDVNMIAFHPATLNTTATAASTTPSEVEVVLPLQYEYTTSGGYQKLDMPMVGIASANPTELPMKHICSAMQVTVTNSFNEGLVLDSIILRNASQMLSGTVTINNLTEAPTVASSGDGSHLVQLNFTGTTIGAGSSLTVQIPVLPTSGTTYVSVRGHLATSGTAYRYKRSTSISMSRAQVHRAPVTMTTPASGNHMEEVSTVPAGAVNGVFSVSPNKQVYFSKGNLVYNPNGSGATLWYFHPNQYDRVFSADGEYNGGIVDLFTWGATGLNGVAPNDRDHNYYRGSSELSGNNDWGKAYNNANSTTGWRTLTGGQNGEWYYLLNTRGTNNNWACYAKVTINVNSGVAGLIIFPDGVNISGNTATLAGVTFTNANDELSTFNSKTINESEWSALEAAGCVFLPAAGYRYGTVVIDVGGGGYYWSSTPGDVNYWSSTPGDVNVDYAYFVSFDDDLNADNVNRFLGQSVRLVQDKNTH